VAYRTGVALDYPVRNIAVARDDAVRNTGRSMDGLGSEAVPHVGRGVDGMEATAAMEATAMKAASVKTAAMETAAMETTAMETTAAVKASTVSAAPVCAASMTATVSSLGNVRERQSQDCCSQDCCQHCTRNNPRERPRDAFAVPSSQHVCLHRNRRQLGDPAAPWPPGKTLWPVNKFRSKTAHNG
jgi:hypothetical protein